MPQVEARLAQSFDVILSTDDRAMPQDEIVAKAAGCDGLLVTSMDTVREEMIAALPRSIRIIATFSAGFDHISIPAAKARGIAVTNTPGVLTDATADIAMLLILGAARGASWGDRMVRENRWAPPSPISPLGYDVTGRSLGILGMGRIGQALARRAHAFGMAIHYHNRRPVQMEKGLEPVYHPSFSDMLPHCDFLSVNCASTVETRGIVNAETIGLLPDGAILVNSARGDIVDDGAVIAALKSGKLAAAGLDVFRNEPDIDPRYRTLDNVFLLPHLGSATPGTRTAMGMRALDNLEAFFRGETPRDLLTGD